LRELEILAEFRKKVLNQNENITKICDLISHLDLMNCFASLALTNGYVKPIVEKSNNLDVKDGRHPVLDILFNKALKEFTPNCTDISNETGNFVLITGPNMGGKSTYLRQNALLIIMAQIGSFVPASSATIGLVDSLFTRVLKLN
jgi:DNA mismatch repair protein MutS